MVTFLTVLKICGIVIGCFLAIIILFISLLLLIPFRYDVDLNVREKKMKTDAVVRWDAKAVRVWYSQFPDGSHDGEALLFGIPLMRFNEDSDWMDQQIAKAKKWAAGIRHGIKEAPEGPVERLRRIRTELTKPRWVKVSKKLFGRIKTIVLEVFPKQGKGEVIFGTEDPYFTGQILEALAFLYPVYGKIFDICPNFSEKVFLADLNLKGKFQAGKVVYQAVLLLFGKRSRSLYREFMRLTHNE